MQRPINDISFRSFLAEHKLMGSECAHCGAHFLPPRPICIRCNQSDMEWIEFQGLGRLVAFTCITVAPPAMIAEGYGRDNPYCVGVVEMADGIRVDAQIVGVDPSRPENIKVGAPMKVKYIMRGSEGTERTILAFEPARDE